MHPVDVKSVLAARNGMNLYRGCTHGCIYCDSRSACYRMDHAFEDVAVKRAAPALLEQALRRRRQPGMLSTGAMSDPYQPLEATERLTRRALELALQYGFGFTALTKSDLILRDLDLWTRLHRETRCVVQMTLTTLDEDLCRVVEPNVCTTRRRVEALHVFRELGIPTVVWLCPVLPFLNDTEENLRGILDLCFAAGVRGILCFSMGVTLRQGNREYFYAQLDRHFPGMKARYRRTFGSRYACDSPDAPRLEAVFHDACRARGVLHRPAEIFAYLRAFPPAGEQLSLF